VTVLINDLRFACRSLLRQRGFSVTAVLTLALGMALFLSAAIVTRAYLLRDLPYPAAERLHWLRYSEPGAPEPRGMAQLDWTAVRDVIEHSMAWDLDVFYMLGREQAEPLPGAWVTPSFLDALGVRAALGRGIQADAFVDGGPNEVLISHRLWQTRFGGSEDAIGSRFTAYVADRPEESERFTIVGVLPQDFWHLNTYTEVLAPLRTPAYPYMARLRPGVSPEAARDRITAFVTSGAHDVPPGWSLRLVAVHDAYVGSLRPTLRAVVIAGMLVLLVACANVAALMLVRGNGRRKEVAIRAALGASRAAIARMLTLDAVVLAAVATLLAVLVTAFALDAIGPLVQQQMGRPAPDGGRAFALDATLLLFAAAGGLVTALACSLAPLVTLVRPRSLAAIHGRARTTTDGRGATRFRSSLIALEIAASLALLAGAGLMLRSAHGLANADLGLSPERVMTGGITLRHSTYPDVPSRVAVFDELLERLEAVPGAETVALANMWPMQEARLQPITAERSRTETRAPIQGVTHAYFDTLGIPIRAGRAFTPADRQGSAPVAIVSETLARRLWPNADPRGQHIETPPPQGSTEPRRRVVVGVAGDVRQGPSDAELADVYVPLLQEPTRFAFALVRTTGSPDRTLTALGNAVSAVDPEIALDRPVPMQQLVDRMNAGSRFLAALLGGFAAAAVALSLVGLYGAIAYAVRQREREIAVRVAIGADPAAIVRLFVRQGGVILLGGLAVGVPAAFAVGRVIESQLFGVTAFDPFGLAAASAAFGVAALLATWWPARRAAATDPAIALRSE
jgi:putative ABC transport system permease protein